MSADEAILNLYKEAFPAVSAGTRARFKSFLAARAKDHKWMFSGALKGHLSQGDIIAPLPAFFFDGTSVKQGREPGPGILLEHECDMSVDDGQVRNSHYVFAPLIPADVLRDYFDDFSAIENNSITHKIYFSALPPDGAAYVADLNMIGSLRANWLHEALEKRSLSRLASLSDNGFYFLLAKLTVHFLRANSSADAA